MWTVGRAFEEYAADCRKNRGEGAERTLFDMADGLERYLSRWKDLLSPR